MRSSCPRKYFSGFISVSTEHINYDDDDDDDVAAMAPRRTNCRCAYQLSLDYLTALRQLIYRYAYYKYVLGIYIYTPSTLYNRYICLLKSAQRTRWQIWSALTEIMGVSRGKFNLIGIYYSSILYVNLLEIHIIIEIYTQKTVKVEKILEVKYFIKSLLKSIIL